MAEYQRYNSIPVLDIVAEVVGKIQPDFPEMFIVPLVQPRRRDFLRRIVAGLPIDDAKKKRLIRNPRDQKSFEKIIYDFRVIANYDDIVDVAIREIQAQPKKSQGYYSRLWPMTDGRKLLFVNVADDLLNPDDRDQIQVSVLTAPYDDAYDGDPSLADEILRDRQLCVIHVAAHEIGHGLADFLYAEKSELYSDGFAALFMTHHYAHLFKNPKDALGNIFDRKINLARVESQKPHRWDYPIPAIIDVLADEYCAAAMMAEIEGKKLTNRDLMQIVRRAVRNNTVKNRIAVWNKIAKHQPALVRQIGVGDKTAIAHIVANTAGENERPVFDFLFEVKPLTAKNAGVKLTHDPFVHKAHHAEMQKMADGENQLALNIMARHKRADLIQSFAVWMQDAADCGWQYGDIRGAIGFRHACESVPVNYFDISQRAKIEAENKRAARGTRKYNPASPFSPHMHNMISFSKSLPAGDERKNIMAWIDLYRFGFPYARRVMLDMARKKIPEIGVVRTKTRDLAPAAAFAQTSDRSR